MKNPNPMRYISGLFLIYNFSLVIVASHCLTETTVATAILHQVLCSLQELYFPCQIIPYLSKKYFVRPTGERYL